MDWKKIRKFLPIIGIGLFVYLLIKLDVFKIIKEIKEINAFYLVAIFFLMGIFFMVQPWKWLIIARKQKIKISFKEALKINLIANFYGFVTPGRLGTLIRINYLKKKGASTGKGLSNFIIDKILDLCSLFILAIGLGFLFYNKIIPPCYLPLFLILFGIILALFLIFYKKENSRKILKSVYKKFIPEKMKEKSKNLFNSFYENFPKISSLPLILLINLLTWVISYFIFYIIGMSLGIEINFIPFLAILSISTLVAQIPITINGLGTREMTLIGLFSLFGIDAVKVFSMSILGIILLGVIPSFFAIIIILINKKNGIHNIKKSR